MSTLPSPRLLRAMAALAALCAFAVAPVAAQAATTNATGTLTAGGLTNAAPAITPFSVALNGTTQTVHTNVGPWNVTDATGSNAGYSVTVAADCRDGWRGDSGCRYRIVAHAALDDGGGPCSNPAAAGPLPATAQLLSTTAATIDNATAGTGQGEWDFPADTGAGNLSIVIPGDASIGAHSSTLTFTTAPPVA